MVERERVYKRGEWVIVDNVRGPKRKIVLRDAGGDCVTVGNSLNVTSGMQYHWTYVHPTPATEGGDG